MNDQTASEIATYFRVCGGARVRYADTKNASDTVVLLLAPWPETLWAYRRIWSQVTAIGRVVALDMPGFGHSDQPEELGPGRTSCRWTRRRDSSRAFSGG
jgi:pimeloyl-ACP methyl ester carboxylesterase